MRANGVMHKVPRCISQHGMQHAHPAASRHSARDPARSTHIRCNREQSAFLRPPPPVVSMASGGRFSTRLVRPDLSGGLPSSRMARVYRAIGSYLTAAAPPRPPAGAPAPRPSPCPASGLPCRPASHPTSAPSRHSFIGWPSRPGRRPWTPRRRGTRCRRTSAPEAAQTCRTPGRSCPAPVVAHGRAVRLRRTCRSPASVGPAAVRLHGRLPAGPRPALVDLVRVARPTLASCATGALFTLRRRQGPPAACARRAWPPSAPPSRPVPSWRASPSWPVPCARPWPGSSSQLLRSFAASPSPCWPFACSYLQVYADRDREVTFAGADGEPASVAFATPAEALGRTGGGSADRPTPSSHSDGSGSLGGRKQRPTGEALHPEQRHLKAQRPRRRVSAPRLGP